MKERVPPVKTNAGDRKMKDKGKDTARRKICTHCRCERKSDKFSVLANDLIFT
jgi:hypothetical protein